MFHETDDLYFKSLPFSSSIYRLPLLQCCLLACAAGLSRRFFLQLAVQHNRKTCCKKLQIATG